MFLKQTPTTKPRNKKNNFVPTFAFSHPSHTNTTTSATYYTHGKTTNTLTPPKVSSPLTYLYNHIHRLLSHMKKKYIDTPKVAPQMKRGTCETPFFSNISLSTPLTYLYNHIHHLYSHMKKKK